MMRAWLFVLGLLFAASPALAQFSGGGSGGGVGGGGGGSVDASSDVSDVSVTTATNPSAEAQLKQLTVPAGMLNVLSRKVTVHGSGRYTTAAAQTPTIRTRVYLCTVSGCGSGTVLTLADFTSAATTASTTNSWRIEGSIGTAATGATGTVETKWQLYTQLGAAADLTPETRLDQNNAVSSTINLTGVLYLRVTTLMSSANAGNSVSQRMGYIAGSGGAPTDATYLLNTGNSSLPNAQTLSGLSTGCAGVTTTTGLIVSRTITGTANQITIANGDCSGAPTISIASTFDLSGKSTTLQDNNLTLQDNADTTKKAVFELSGITTGTTRTLTLPNASVTLAPEPTSNGLYARTAASAVSARTITGTSNQITCTNGDGVAGNPTCALSSTLVIPGPQIDFTESAGDGTCAAGDYWIKANSTSTNFRKCQNGTITDMDTGGAGSIGGSTGATDRAVLIANGTGGGTLQSATGCTISAGNQLTCSGGFVGGTSGTGTLTLLEGTAPGAGTNAGEHNVYFDSGDSKLKSHKNGGSVQIYTRAADNLSVFAATTSAQLAGVLSDEIGSSGGFVLGTGATLTTPTINTPTFGGSAPTLADGVTWTFNPNGTSAGLNVGAQAGALGAPNNGDVYYDSTANKFKCRENGSTVDCISTGAGSGDVTDVTAGVGIAVTNPGGPAPAVAWDPSTFTANVTLWSAASATRTLTANLSGATDPVITFGDSSIDVTTGTLKQGGVNVSTAASSDTLTNKGYDAEGTGNVLTLPRRHWYPAAGCNNATAGAVWDLPTSAPAVAACVTGTNTQKGVLDFADGSNLSAQFTHLLPTTWTGNLDVNLKWFSATTTNSVVWQVATICVADAETDDPAFNTASTVTDAAKGTTNQTNDAAITSVTITGCAAGELMHVKVFRDSGHASDTHAGTARLLGVELVVREAI